MTERIKNRIGSDKGAVTLIEAAFIFPIMFIILIALIYFGNAFYQKACIVSMAERYAIEGANRCADPLLDTVSATGKTPSVSDVSPKPYRYIFTGYMEDIESSVEKELVEEFNGNYTFFAGMNPVLKTHQSDIAAYNNYLVYATFEVNVDYEIHFPIRMIDGSSLPIMKLHCHAEAPVSSAPEFIRNTDMVIDILDEAGVLDKIDAIKSKIGEMFGKLTDVLKSLGNGG